jgi:hypothetical protein
MSIFSNLNIAIGKTINTVDTIADLRNYKPRNIIDGDTVIVSAGTTLGDANGGAFVWAEGATAFDDATDAIKPVFAVGSGRWMRAFGGRGPIGDKGDTGGRGPIGDKGDTGAQGAGLADVIAPGGSALVGFTQTGGQPSTVQTALSAFAVPNQYAIAGETGDSAKLQRLFNSGKKLIYIPEGIYLITEPVIIPSFVTVICSAATQFNAGADGLSMFKTEILTPGVTWKSGVFFGNGFDNVIAMDLSNFRALGAEITSITVAEVECGIYLRTLCWDLSIRNFYCQNVGDGIVLENGSNAVTIDHPSLNGFRKSGIHVKPGTGDLPNVGNNIIGGYAQYGPVGILDQAYSTMINGTYFELCDEADIKLDGAQMPNIQRSYHSSVLGVVCVKGRNTDGARIDNVVLQGDRTGGLFDFDNTNTYCRATTARTAVTNTNTGITAGLRINYRGNGTLEPGDTIFEDTFKTDVVVGPSPGNYFRRASANGYDDVGVGPGAVINVEQSPRIFYQAVQGGETFTFVNMREGQTVELCFKSVAALTSQITLGGKLLDSTGSGIDTCKVVTIRLVQGSYFIIEGNWL